MTTKVRVCEKCNEQNPIDAWSCASCGATLSVDTITEASSIVKEGVENQIGNDLAGLETRESQEPILDEGLLIKELEGKKIFPNEKVLFEEQDIKITNYQAIFGPNTYEMNSISSVTSTKRSKNYCGLLSALAVIGAISLICSFNNYSSAPKGIYYFSTGLAVICLLVIMAIITSSTPNYLVLQVTDTHGVHDAYQFLGKNEERVKMIVLIMNNAINMLRDEDMLLEEKGVIITNKRAIFGSNIYDIKDIRSVTEITIEQDKSTIIKVYVMWSFIVIGVICIIVQLIQNPRTGPGVYWDERLWLIFGIIFIFLGRMIGMMEDLSIHYMVQISDDNGVHDAYQSKDKECIKRIVQIMNVAINMPREENEST